MLGVHAGDFLSWVIFLHCYGVKATLRIREGNYGAFSHIIFRVFENIFLIKDPVQALNHEAQISDCFPPSLRLPNRLSTPGWPSRRPLPSNKSGRETSRFFFFKRGGGVCTQPSLAWGLSNCFDLCVNCLLPLPLMKIFQLTQFARYERIFLFLLLRRGGVLNF